MSEMFYVIIGLTIFVISSFIFWIAEIIIPPIMLQREEEFIKVLFEDAENAEDEETPKYTKSALLKVQISPEAKEMLEAEISNIIEAEMLLRAEENFGAYRWVDLSFNVSNGLQI